MVTPAITEPASQGFTARAIGVRVGQPLRLTASPATYFWTQTNGGTWTAVSGLSSKVATVVYSPPSVTNYFTFDTVRIAAQDTTPAGGLTGDFRDFDVAIGPVTTLQATSSIRNESLREPLARPDDIEHDDPPLAFPLGMPGANRDGMGTVRIESPMESSGPANLASLLRP